LELPCVTVTPGVVVVSVAEICRSVAHPLFLRATLRLTHSLLLMTPLWLPEESSMVKPFDSRFEPPLIEKFWVTVPPLVTTMFAEAGDAVVQFRSGYAAVAMYVPGGTKIEKPRLQLT